MYFENNISEQNRSNVNLEPLAISNILLEIDKNKITVIKAQSGFDKSATLRKLQIDARCNSLYLSIDKHDNNPIYFIDKIIGELGKIDSDTLISDSFSQSAPNHLYPVGTSKYIEDLITSNNIKLILIDDLDVLKSKSSNDILSEIINRLNQLVKVVFTCKSNVIFNIGDMVINNGHSIIDEKILKFSHGDITRILESKNIELSDTNLVTELLALTDGWPLAIRYVFSSVTNQRELKSKVSNLNSGDNNLSIYFYEHLFKNQPIEIVDFMGKLSVVDKFNLPLCNAITSDKKSNIHLLTLIDTCTLLTHLPNNWFSFNKLALQYLRRKSILSMGISTYREYQKSSALWLYNNHHYIDAINLILELKEFNRAADWLLESFSHLVSSKGETLLYYNWVLRLPTVQLDDKPLLRANYIFVLVLSGKVLEANENIDILINNSPSIEPEYRSTIIRKIDLALCIMAALQDNLLELELKIECWIKKWSCDSDTKVESDLWFEQGLAHLIMGYISKNKSQLSAGKNFIISSIQYFRAANSHFGMSWSRSILSLLYSEQGLHSEALNEVNLTILYVNDYLGSDSLLIGVLSSINARLHYNSGNIDLARQHIISVKGHSRNLLSTDVYIDYYSIKFKTSVYLGNASTAVEQLKTDICWAECAANERLKNALTSCLISYYISNNKIEHAKLYSEISEIKSNKPNVYDIDLLSNRVKCKSIILVFFTNNNFHSSIELLRLLIERSRTSGEVYQLSEWLMLISIALFKTNRLDEAITNLADALAISSSNSDIYLFVDTGYMLLDVLKELELSGTFTGPFLRSLFNSFKVRGVVFELKFEKLTVKEQSISRKLSEGLLNKQIANDMGISLGTLKWHLQNIYTKFNVKNRTNAISIAKQEGYI